MKRTKCPSCGKLFFPEKNKKEIKDKIYYTCPHCGFKITYVKMPKK